MRSRHRTRAWIGVSCFFAFLLTFIGLLVFRHSGHESMTFQQMERIGGYIGLSVVMVSLSFFWAAYQLAKAKGYSGAIALMGIIGPPAQLVVLLALILLKDKHSDTPLRSTPKKHRSRYGSNLERIVAHRRNALIGNVCGFVGIMLGVMFVLVDFGMFEDHDNSMALGIFIFLVGYCGVIAGCRWWLKAKEWIDAIVFIAFLPLMIFLIPFVRLIYVAVPSLLPASMVMMPIILIVVILVLPDKSGWAGRKRWRIDDKH